MTTTETQISLVEWIRTALNNATLPPASAIYLNGYGERAEVREAIAAIEICHKQTGVAGLKTAWDNTISAAIPDIAELLNKPRRMLHGSELGTLPPTRWLIENEIPESCIAVVYGAPGVGKSFVSLDYAERVGQHKKVAYIMGEGRSGYKARHEAWLKFQKKTDKYLYFYDGSVTINNAQSFSEFYNECVDIRPRLIVVDTFAKCFNGEENSAKEVGEFIRACDKLKTDFNATILIVHHSTKGGSGERGSSALRGAADVMIEVSDDEGYIKIECDKMKDTAAFDSRKVRRHELELQPGITSCVLLPAGMVKMKKDDLTANQYEITKWLATGVFEDGARTSDLVSATGLAKGSFFSALNNLKSRGFIRKAGKYDPWYLTPEGEELANRLGLRSEV